MRIWTWYFILLTISFPCLAAPFKTSRGYEYRFVENAPSKEVQIFDSDGRKINQLVSDRSLSSLAAPELQDGQVLLMGSSSAGAKLYLYSADANLLRTKPCEGSSDEVELAQLSDGTILGRLGKGIGTDPSFREILLWAEEGRCFGPDLLEESPAVPRERWVSIPSKGRALETLRGFYLVFGDEDVQVFRRGFDGDGRWDGPLASTYHSRIDPNSVFEIKREFYFLPNPFTVLHLKDGGSLEAISECDLPAVVEPDRVKVDLETVPGHIALGHAEGWLMEHVAQASSGTLVVELWRLSRPTLFEFFPFATNRKCYSPLFDRDKSK